MLARQLWKECGWSWGSSEAGKRRASVLRNEKKTDLEEWEEIIPFCIKSIMRLPFSPGLSLGCCTPGVLTYPSLIF